MEFDLETSDQGLKLGLAERFAVESTVRTIDACEDLEQLKGLAKQLYQSWVTTRAMLRHQMFIALPPPLSEYLEAKQTDADSPE